MMLRVPVDLSGYRLVLALIKDGVHGGPVAKVGCYERVSGRHCCDIRVRLAQRPQVEAMSSDIELVSPVMTYATYSLANVPSPQTYFQAEALVEKGQ